MSFEFNRGVGVGTQKEHVALFVCLAWGQKLTFLANLLEMHHSNIFTMVPSCCHFNIF